MKLSEEQMIFAKNLAKLINYIFESGFYCTLGELYRTKEQAEIYAEKGIGIKNSLHCKRLAIDLNIFNPEGQYTTNLEDYAKFGKFWKTLHPQNRWGGDFQSVDSDHFEMQDFS